MSEVGKIREWQGSKNAAFEELCCQLAACEYSESKGVFRRIRGAGGDAGVEGYWLFKDGTEHGWQAKFFDKLGPSQWHQIDKSVKTALVKHSELVTYTVCLPIDRDEGRKPRQKSVMDHWNEHVAAWNEYASKQGMEVAFRYWGESEIHDRLIRPEHTGRRLFWYSEDELTDEWMNERLKASLAVAGERYTPQANVVLPIHEVLDGVARTDAFYDRIESLNDKLAESMRGLNYRNPAQPEIQTALQFVTNAYRSVDEMFSRLERGSVMPIDFQNLGPSVTALQNCAEECRHLCDDCIRAYITKKPDRKLQKIPDPHLSELESTSYLLLRVISAGTDVLQFLESPCANSANTGALLVLGDAGQGKTHLLCDVASDRLRAGLPTVVLFGEGFNKSEPWSQMAMQLHLNAKTPEEFLGALDALGETRGHRSLIMVDALNETDERSFWSRYLPDMLVSLAKYRYVALCVSCRSSYEPQVIPSQVVPDLLTRAVHSGFAGEEGAATSVYFRAYGIKEPNIPVLTPEFSNPLFLKLFCTSMKEKGLSDVPSGLRGITAMFDFFVDAMHTRLSRKMDYDGSVNYVSQALTALADRMAESQLSWVVRDEAKTIVDSLLPGRIDYSKTLYRNLVVEGLLVENVHPVFDPKTDNYVNKESIRFGFEKFTDHIVVKRLLDKHLDESSPQRSFRKGKPLGDLFPGEHRVWRVGWIEALSVQIPERLGCELVDLVPRAKEWHDLREPFLKSLVWRDPEKTSESTNSYLNHVFSYGHQHVYNIMLMLACDPRHPYNAKRLHHHLKRLRMPDRDHLWSIFLHEWHSEDGPVDRLINWAWGAQKSHICDDSIELAATALIWYLTSSNRFIRDRATKALVSLLQDRPRVLLRLLPLFADVDDLYVRERLYAVCYGVAMRTRDDEALCDLAVDVFQRLFAKNVPTPHILLRDYARGVIEVAAHRDALTSTVELELARPPYQSEWPLEIPEEAEISHHGEYREGMTRVEWSSRAIYGSVTGDDFSHYVIDPQADHWLEQRIGETMGPNKMTADEFLDSLTKRQKAVWDRYRRAEQDALVRQKLGTDIAELVIACTNAPNEEAGAVPDESESPPEHLEKLACAFRHSLGKRKLAVFDQFVVPYLNHPRRGTVDFQEVRRWIIKRAYGLGWTSDRFGQFDAFVGSHLSDYRTGRKPERIGKKYQWIAFHEFLAHLADHNLITEGFSDEVARPYSSPNQIDIRDIDPSQLTQDMQDDENDDPCAEWWSPVAYDFHDASLDEKLAWTLCSEHMPSPRSLISIADPATGCKWLSMYSNYSCRERHGRSERQQTPYREQWMLVRCYLVRKEHSDEANKHLLGQCFWGPGISDALHIGDVFLGEYPWASEQSASAEYWGWMDEFRGLSRPIAMAAAEYNTVSGRDCSIGQGFSALLPSPLLVRTAGLEWSRRGFAFAATPDDVVVFDPSAGCRRGCLLMREDFAHRFLEQSDYDLIWALVGKRELYGRDDGDRMENIPSISGAYRYVNGQLTGYMTEYITTYGKNGRTTDQPGRIIHELV